MNQDREDLELTEGHYEELIWITDDDKAWLAVQVVKEAKEAKRLQELAQRYVTFCEAEMDEDEMNPESREILNGFKSALAMTGG